MAIRSRIREGVSDLYTKIAGTFYKPSSAETDNMAAIESRFNAAKQEFRKGKHFSKFSEIQTKNKQEPVIIKSFDEFLKTD